jgi:hypothetical protein
MRCTDRTEPICIQKNLFGESQQSWEYLTSVKPGDLGILYNLDSKQLIGPWAAVSEVGTSESDAWNEGQYHNTIPFDAQIKVKPLWSKLYRISDYPKKLGDVQGIDIIFLKNTGLIPKKNVYRDNHIYQTVLGLFENERAREGGANTNIPPITYSSPPDDKNQTLLDLNNNYTALFYSIQNDSTDEFIDKAAFVIFTLSEYARKRGIKDKLQEKMNYLKNSQQ